MHEGKSTIVTIYAPKTLVDSTVTWSLFKGFIIIFLSYIQFQIFIYVVTVFDIPVIKKIECITSNT